MTDTWLHHQFIPSLLIQQERQTCQAEELPLQHTTFIICPN